MPPFKIPPELGKPCLLTACIQREQPRAAPVPWVLAVPGAVALVTFPAGMLGWVQPAAPSEEANWQERTGIPGTATFGTWPCLSSSQSCQETGKS